MNSMSKALPTEGALAVCSTHGLGFQELKAASNLKQN